MSSIGSNDEYVKETEAMRREKDYFFKEDVESPIPHRLRHDFKGLAYFPPDPNYRVQAKLIKDPNPERVVLATSKGVPREMIRYGVLELDRKSTRLNSSHVRISYAVFCLKKKK